MTMTTSQPLGAYITEREKATVFRRRRIYADAQRAADARCAIVNGYRTRHALEEQAFIRQIIREVRERGEKLYPVDGEKIPVRGKVSGR
jgi:hypothetical protein